MNLKQETEQSLILLNAFLRKPFAQPITELKDDKKLVFIATFLSAITMIIQAVTNTYSSQEPLGFFFYIIIGLLLTPLFGLLIVHFKGNVFHLFLRYVASPILKIDINNNLKAKQIQTFVTIALIVSSVPSLSNVGIVIGIIIEALGINRLFNINLLRSTVIAVIYNSIWWGLLYILANGTVWI